MGRGKRQSRSSDVLRTGWEMGVISAGVWDMELPVADLDVSETKLTSSLAFKPGL